MTSGLQVLHVLEQEVQQLEHIVKLDVRRMLGQLGV